MSEAFLVLVLDTSASPPVVMGASVFGEEQPTLGMNRRCFTVHSERAPTYDEAEACVRRSIEHHPFLAWVRPIFRERDGSNPFAVPDVRELPRPVTFGLDEGVLEGIRIFSERYAYALPTRKGEVKS